MATHTFELRLAAFQFPAVLPNEKANFRIVVDIRYENPDGAFVTEHAVLPGLDTFWECAVDKANEPNYVRAANSASFDMSKVDEWDSLVLLFKGSRVHAINVSVLDVNRKDAWDSVKEQLGPVIETLVGRAAKALPVGPIGDALGAAADDVKAYALRKLAGGDKVLFKKSAPLAAVAPPGQLEQMLTGPGVGGKYTVAVTLKIIDAAAATIGIRGN
jgi:hypothetical protein